MAKENGKFESDMSLEEFRTQLIKFGEIISDVEGAKEDTQFAGLNLLLKNAYLNYGQGVKK